MRTMSEVGPVSCDCPVVEVRVCGELDLAAAARVAARLEDALNLRPERLFVDMSSCSFVDAAGISVLLDAHRQAWRQGAAFTLRGCSERQLKVLALMGLHQVFDVAEEGAQ